MNNATSVDQFKQMLNAAQQGENTRRKQAEESLKQYQSDNLVLFVQNLMLVINEVTDAPNHPQIRQLAAILFRNTLREGIFRGNQSFF